MKIYGVAILAACYLAGQLIVMYLGKLIGIGVNVGGVGFGMLLLIWANSQFKDTMPGVERHVYSRGDSYVCHPKCEISWFRRLGGRPGRDSGYWHLLFSDSGNCWYGEA